MRRLALLRIPIVVFSAMSTAAFASPDVVYVNGTVLTVDDQFSIAGGFSVESGRFVAVGDSAGIQKLAGGKTKVVDLGGRTVIPGLIDNHNHFVRGAQHWGTAFTTRFGVWRVVVLATAAFSPFFDYRDAWAFLLIG